MSEAVKKTPRRVAKPKPPDNEAVIQEEVEKRLNIALAAIEDGKEFSNIQRAWLFRLGQLVSMLRDSDSPERPLDDTMKVVYNDALRAAFGRIERICDGDLSLPCANCGE